MKIAIDISPVVYGTGVSVYTKNLIKSLLTLNSRDQYVLFGGSLRRMGELDSFVSTLKGTTLQGRILPLAPKMLDILWNRLHILPIEKLVGKVDVYHSSDWTQAPSNAFKVTTIHDLVPFFYPEASHARIVTTHTRRLEWVKREVDRVIVPSVQTAEDAVRFGIQEKRLRIIPESVDHGFNQASQSEVLSIKKRFGISKRYLLAVGTSHRKNLSGIISAFKTLKKDLDLELVIVGELPVSHKGEQDILFLGRVEDRDRAALYSGAEVFLYPSFYEGFGLPILESFSCKTPVVTSNIGSMKELSEGAAVLVNPKDIKSISGGVLKALKEKKRLVESGTNRLKKYSWSKAAKETHKVYQEMA